MTETPSESSPNDLAAAATRPVDAAPDAGRPDALERAAADGPIWSDSDDSGPDEENLEAAEAHDSPAAVDEERADAGEDEPDELYSIYGPPPGDREGNRE